MPYQARPGCVLPAGVLYGFLVGAVAVLVLYVVAVVLLALGSVITGQRCLKLRPLFCRYQDRAVIVGFLVYGFAWSKLQAVAPYFYYAGAAFYYIQEGGPVGGGAGGCCVHSIAILVSTS